MPAAMSGVLGVPRVIERAEHIVAYFISQPYKVENIALQDGQLICSTAQIL